MSVSIHYQQYTKDHVCDHEKLSKILAIIKHKLLTLSNQRLILVRDIYYHVRDNNYYVNK